MIMMYNIDIKEEKKWFYTVTFNPSLDYIVSVEDFQLGKTNRTAKEQMLPGGKGINVSTVLKNLGIPNTALGFSAGFTGEEIKRRVEEMGLASDFIDLPNGYSRINVKMKDFDGTEINGQGPDISPEETERLLRKLDSLKEEDVLVLAGSIPQDHAGFHLQRYPEKAGGKRHPGSGRRHGRAFAPCSGVQTFPDQA